MRRRALIAGAGSLTISAFAGCLGAVGMDEHEAAPAGVDPSVRTETGYEQIGIEELVIEEPVEAPGISEDVTVRNYLTEHEKAIEFPSVGTIDVETSIRAAAFTVLTSPQISVAGRELNPIEAMSAHELIELVEANFDGIGNIDYVGDSSVSILDQETTVSVFEADADVEGFTIDVNVHISESVRTSSDHLVTVGVYPQRVQRTEETNISSMMQGVVETVQ